MSRGDQRAHFPAEIAPGSDYDRLLRQLLGGANFQQKNPAFCTRHWCFAIYLAESLRDQDETVTTLSLATYISACRMHLKRRWGDHWDIVNKQPFLHGKKHSMYRVMTMEELHVYTARKLAYTRRKAGPVRRPQPTSPEARPAAGPAPFACAYRGLLFRGPIF